MKRSVLFVFVILLGISELIAQNIDLDKSMSLQQLQLTFQGQRAKSYDDIQGSPYYTDEFVQGRIISKDTSEYSAMIRYNIYADQLEYMEGNKKYFVTKPSEIQEVQMGAEKMIYSDYLQAGVKYQRFFLLKKTGKYTLLQRKKIEFLPMETPRAVTANYKPDRFESKNDEFYISFGNKPAQKFTSLKNLKKIAPELVPIIDEFKKENSVNTKRVEDLEKLFDYLNAKG